jgi:hypothetical protein
VCNVSRRYEADVTLYNRLALEAVALYRVQINDPFGAVMAGDRNWVLHEDGVPFTPEGYALLSR